MVGQVKRKPVYSPRVRGAVELLLAENVSGLGQQGEIVRVKPGYARNYLLPHGLATIATEENKQAVEAHRVRLEEVEQKRRAGAKKLADTVSKYSVTLEANANEEGHLYGSILAGDISKSLKDAGYAVDVEHIRLDGPLKELGMYTVKLQLHPDVSSEVKVWVVPASSKK
ncbi:MAG: 50S ribosomal protein L9 [Rubinisphaera brasiliensis]|uniref:Large ribosomal subunit protein bL9 n=1 Tax=Rubinisphaera brasiliensis (strain ATCC 49424 / DSM 5305 / JCM 21570 / IAM 15109 / NBRC 103401 / IFAM 1448) TaxID=756272 RepID=F0SN40_RUBBR|nr:50S ribosomal protein L9 [Rubinisphaera brasiliensis]ADY61069.1 LSU ribosomal protein L9P [Rubinisphaera brasiliensis DSM 5305]